MSKKTKAFKVDVIKTPEGQVPTVDSFHRVVDGLFGEVLDTRKDVAKLIPNLEKELGSLREILAQQMVLFEVINDSMKKLVKEVKEQGKSIVKIQKLTADTAQAGMSQAELTADSQKAIGKLLETELEVRMKPISAALKVLQNDIAKSSSNTLKKVDKQLDAIKEQIDDLSSKSELQMLEIVESLNQRKPSSSTSKASSSTTKKKLTS